MANEHRGTCPGCGELVYPDVCQCGIRMEDHGEDSGHDPVPFGCRCRFYNEEAVGKKSNDEYSLCPKCECPILTEEEAGEYSHTSTCMCNVPIRDMFLTIESDLVRLGVSSHIWVARTRDVLWLMLQIQKRLLQEIEKSRPPLPQHPDVDYDGIEEAYSPNSVRMCYRCMTRHRPSEDCAPWPEQRPFENTEPPPADKETSVLPPTGSLAPKAQPCPTCGEMARSFHPFYTPPDDGGTSWEFSGTGVFFCPQSHIWKYDENERKPSGLPPPGPHPAPPPPKPRPDDKK